MNNYGLSDQEYLNVALYTMIAEDAVEALEKLSPDSPYNQYFQDLSVLALDKSQKILQTPLKAGATEQELSARIHTFTNEVEDSVLFELKSHQRKILDNELIDKSIAMQNQSFHSFPVTIANLPSQPTKKIQSRDSILKQMETSLAQRIP